jgi:hypothetical protein
MKICSEPIHNTAAINSILGDIFYYFLCFLGIFFGFYLTKLFKSIIIYLSIYIYIYLDSLTKNTHVENLSLDTSYKRKYDKM